MNVPPFDRDLWFARHLQPHEPMLRAWLRRLFSTDAETDDIIQDAYLRVLEARAAHEIKSPKAFLFATARNLALGSRRHHRVQREISLAEVDELAVLDGNADVPRMVVLAEELELLTQAIQSLPDRCRQILVLRKIHGLPQKEIAARLGIAEHTVEAQGTIGLRKIAEFFERLDRPALSRHE